LRNQGTKWQNPSIIQEHCCTDKSSGFPLFEIFCEEKKFEKNEVDDNIQIINFLASELAAYRMECSINQQNRFVVRTQL
jgi:hypothetical protein